MLEQFTPGEVVVLRRNPNYYEPDLPLLDRIEYRTIPDETTRLAAVNGKAAHYTWSVNRILDTQVAKTVGILQTDPTSYCGQHGLAFNQTKLPFADVRVRRAVSVGINRNELIAAVLAGRGQLSTKIPPCDDEFSHAGEERLPYYAADRALGRKLLAEAGWPGGFDATLVVPSAFPQTVRTGEVMKEQLARIGVRVSIESVDWDVALERFIRTKYDGMAMIPLVWQPDPDAHMYNILHSESSINLGRFKDRIVDRLLEQGRATTEPISRGGIYRALQRHVADQAYMIFPYASGATELLDDRVRGYVPMPGAGPGSLSRQSFKQVWLTP
jgi:peptide/nickel transport system substrate-binding protein